MALKTTSKRVTHSVPELRAGRSSLAKSLKVKEQAAEICRAVASDFKLKGITQADAAQLLQVDPKAVANQISGKRPFGKKTAKLYASTFGYSEPFLLYGEGNLLTTHSSKSLGHDGELVTISLDQYKSLEQRVAILEKLVTMMDVSTPTKPVSSLQYPRQMKKRRK